MKPIYERIEELCHKSGTNVTKLCSACNIPRASLSDYKNGRTKSLSAETLSKIADYFGVSVDYLYGKNDINQEEIAKVALFGGNTDVTDSMWEEVKRFVDYVKERENGTK
ncbi:MAG: helix-turn-helix domain-containing protein [Clostridia bacterium]|nr:helix-turn-helix domain-containing protein [Clostridia bacterium]